MTIVLPGFSFTFIDFVLFMLRKTCTVAKTNLWRLLPTWNSFSSWL